MSKKPIAKVGPYEIAYFDFEAEVRQGVYGGVDRFDPEVELVVREVPDLFSAGPDPAHNWMRAPSVISRLLALANEVLEAHGIEDWQSLTIVRGGRKKYGIPLECYLAVNVIEAAQALSEKSHNDDRLVAAMLLGYYVGELLGARWAVHCSKAVLATSKGRTAAMDARRNLLREFMRTNGDVPPMGEFGKTNPDRTKYYQRFKRASRLEFSVDTFNRDVEALLGDPRGPI